jgi:hypothetical protein
MAHNHEAVVSEDRSHNLNLDEAEVLPNPHSRATGVLPPARVAFVERRLCHPAATGGGGVPRAHRQAMSTNVAAVAHPAMLVAVNPRLCGHVLAATRGEDCHVWRSQLQPVQPRRPVSLVARACRR